jgi:hypothetical protein
MVTLKEFAESEGIHFSVSRCIRRVGRNIITPWRACFWSSEIGISVGYRKNEGSQGYTTPAVAHGKSQKSAMRALVRRLRSRVVVLDMQEIPQKEFRAPDDLTS